MTTRIFSHDGWPLDLSPGLSEYEAGMTLDVDLRHLSRSSTCLHNDRIILKRLVTTVRACEAH